MEKRNALLAGATGLVGNQLLNQLIENELYDKIIVITRRPLHSSNEKIIEQLTDFEKVEDLKPELTINDVYCALGTTIKTAGSEDAFIKVDYTYVVNLARWCEKNGVNRFLVVSAMGANEKSSIFYNRIKGKTEAAISKLSIPHIHVFRPSLLMGDRIERRGGEKVAQIVMGFLGFLFAGPLLKYIGIYDIVVAKSMIKAAQSEEKGIRVYESDVMQQMGKRS